MRVPTKLALKISLSLRDIKKLFSDKSDNSDFFDFPDFVCTASEIYGNDL